jgi:hypothetical protein
VAGWSERRPPRKAERRQQHDEQPDFGEQPPGARGEPLETAVWSAPSRLTR